MKNHCETCGETIRIVSVRADGRVICDECYSPFRFKERATDEAAKHDMAYHGGRFETGEW